MELILTVRFSGETGNLFAREEKYWIKRSRRTMSASQMKKALNASGME
jgi:hypothetical protein